MQMAEKNTPELWNRFWDGSASAQADIFRLARHEKGILWQRIEKAVLKELASFEKLEIIEIGAGLGTYAALMARRGACVTVLDYSEVALRRAHEFFGDRKTDISQIAKQRGTFLDQYWGHSLVLCARYQPPLNQ